MAQSILGIDIGSYSVKVSQLTRYLRDFELVHFFEHNLSQSARLTHEESVAAVLRGIFEKNDLEAEIIAVSLPANHLATRVIELPFTNLKKIEQTVEFELEGHVPVSLDDLLVDYHILSIEENRSTVLAAYVPRARFVKYLDTLQVAGVDPKFVGVDSIDFSHIAQIAMVPQESTYVLMDIGHQKTNICVMKGPKLQYVRSIGIGGLHFTRAIQKTFRLNYEKGEALKLDRGRVSPVEGDLDQIGRICQKIAEELIVAIRQSYLGYRQIFNNQEWSSIYVTGGGSRLSGLSDLISAALRINVGSLDCLDFVDHHLDHPESCRDVIAPSLAQTLRVIFSNKAVKINFRKGEFSYQRDIKALGSEIKQLGVWFFVVLFLGIFHFLFTYYSLQSRIEKLDESLVESAMRAMPELKNEKNKSAQKLVSIINNKISELKPQVDALESSSSAKTPLRVLLEISSKLPPKGELTVDIDDFVFTGDLVRLDGRTVSFEAVDKIKNALSQSTYFKNINAPNVVKGIRDEVKFSLSMDINEQ